MNSAASGGMGTVSVIASPWLTSTLPLQQQNNEDNGKLPLTHLR
jgi:hypothetical protein